MGDKTHIQWTDATWNPIRGCSRISEGCRNCYAESVANRFKGEGMPYEGLIAKTGQWNGKINVIDSVIDQPLRWKKPRRIFVNSMSDLFHENLPFTEIDKIFAVMSAANWHTYQVLTKRVDRMFLYFEDGEWIDRVLTLAWDLNPEGAYHETHMIGGLPNVWLGVSVEDQESANYRIPYLLAAPASIRWISAEPLLGPININCIEDVFYKADTDALTGVKHWFGVGDDEATNKLDWVVVGGESGKNARAMHPEWARSLRDQCVDAGVNFFFKQWGEFGPINSFDMPPIRGDQPMYVDLNDQSGGVTRYGKKAAGRLLDGKEWNQYPS